MFYCGCDHLATRVCPLLLKLHLLTKSYEDQLNRKSLETRNCTSRTPCCCQTRPGVHTMDSAVAEFKKDIKAKRYTSVTYLV